MLALAAVALGLSAAGAAPADPWLGNWKSIDTDGSNQTLTITRRADGAYDVVLFDDRASACGGIAANGKGVGTVAGNTMAGTTTITCADGRVLGTFPFKGTYDAKTDTFTDGLGVVWSRVNAPPAPKVGTVPLGRLVLTRKEAPGLKQRAAKPAAAKKALAGALRSAKLPGLAAKTQASRFARGRIDLWSIAFVMKTPKAARTAARAIASKDRGARAGVGSGGYVLGKQDEVVLWWRGRVIAAIKLSRPGSRSTRRAIALDYAHVADARVARALGQTAWTHTLDQIGPTGRISRKTALDMFAVAYGALPGTTRPPGRAGVVRDGTIARLEVIRLWPKLSPAQRTAAARLLGVAGVTRATRTRSFVRPSSRTSLENAIDAATLGDPGFVPNALLQKQAEAFASAISAKLGRPLGLTIVAGGTTTPVAEALADADRVDANGNSSAAGTICMIRQTAQGQNTPLEVRRATLAHEVFHCFQFDITGASVVEMPKWVIEGMADWAGVTLAPSYQAAGTYVEYVETCRETPLFKRTYDAVGFYGHVDDSLGSFWPRVVSTLKASAPTATQAGNVASFNAAGGPLEQFLDSWAPSVMSKPFLGPAWWATKPLEYPPGALACPSIPIIDSTPIEVSPYLLSPYRIESAVPPDRTLLHIETAKGHVRLGDGAIDTADLRDAWFCVGTCKCRPGSEGFPPPAPPLSLPAYLGVTGGPTGATVRVLFESVDTYCNVKQKPPPPPCPLQRLAQARQDCPGGGHSPPGPGETLPKDDPPEPIACYGHGCAHSAADPHLLPFDSPWYDFQGAGEFTLIRSTTDDLEIQVRQQPWPGSRYVAQNVAVAMRVAGDRVGVYRGNPLVVRVNGRPVLLQKKDLRLPRGGAIKPLGEGQIDVVWPDLSAVRVIPTGDLSTDFIVSLAAARQGKVQGLLGNDDPDSNDEDDFTTRGGRRVDPELIHGTDKRAHRALYRIFGESWRVTQRSSLFEYAPGQSTRRFTDRSFPVAIPSVERLNAQLRRKAEAICRRMRIASPRVFRNCVLDVASTGFFSFAVSASTAERSTKKAKMKPKPPPKPRGARATLTFQGKTYTYVARKGSTDGCELDNVGGIAFRLTIGTLNPTDNLPIFDLDAGFLAKKDGTYRNQMLTFEVNGALRQALDLTVTLAGKRTRGTFSGTAQGSSVSGSFRC